MNAIQCYETRRKKDLEKSHLFEVLGGFGMLKQVAVPLLESMILRGMGI